MPSVTVLTIVRLQAGMYSKKSPYHGNEDRATVVGSMIPGMTTFTARQTGAPKLSRKLPSRATFMGMLQCCQLMPPPRQNPLGSHTLRVPPQWCVTDTAATSAPSMFTSSCRDWLQSTAA